MISLVWFYFGRILHWAIIKHQPLQISMIFGLTNRHNESNRERLCSIICVIWELKYRVWSRRITAWNISTDATDSNWIFAVWFRGEKIIPEIATDIEKVIISNAYVGVSLKSVKMSFNVIITVTDLNFRFLWRILMNVLYIIPLCPFALPVIFVHESIPCRTWFPFLSLNRG